MIECEDLGGVTVVRMARGKVNALDIELLSEISKTFAGFADDGPRGIVLTGTGSAFSAGVDLRRIIDGGPAYVRDFLPLLSEAVLAVFNFPGPVVAAVNGHAIAGGAVLAAGCDHRVMGEHGRVGLTEMLVGVPFPLAALEVPAFAWGDRTTRQAILTARTCPPQEALRLGMVDEVTPDPLDAAVEKARHLATAIPSDTYAFTKRQFRHEVNERLRRRRPVEDEQVAELWVARVADGRIASYMESIARR